MPRVVFFSASLVVTVVTAVVRFARGQQREQAVVAV
jgi:hypothetical protein